MILINNMIFIKLNRCSGSQQYDNICEEIEEIEIDQDSIYCAT